MNLVERFFEDFEKEVNKSIVAFNCSMKENYHQLDVKIKNMKGELSQKINSLSTDKVLKTLIGYYSKDEENKINNNLDVLRETIDVCSSKRIALICENSSIQKIINELSNYMYLTF